MHPMWMAGTHRVLANIDADKATNKGPHFLCLMLHPHQEGHRRLRKSRPRLIVISQHGALLPERSRGRGQGRPCRGCRRCGELLRRLMCEEHRSA